MNSFSRFAGVTIVPTLARLVLAVAFVVTGYSKVFTDAEFELTEAQFNALQAEGINLTSADADTAIRHTPHIRLASFQQDQPADEPASPQDAAEDAMQDARDAAEDVMQDAEQAVDEAADDVMDAIDDSPAGEAVDFFAGPTETYTGKKVYKIATLTMTETNPSIPYALPYPKYAAWIGALTELVGGGLLLLGFLSRVWGLGLSVAMGIAFYTTSYGTLSGDLGWNLLELQTNPEYMRAYLALIAQLSLFVLSFGILLTGAGPLSLDALLFGGGGDDDFDD